MNTLFEIITKKQNNGVIMITFVNRFVSCKQEATLDDVIGL
jgi:hypothetical protein